MCRSGVYLKLSQILKSSNGERKIIFVLKNIFRLLASSSLSHFQEILKSSTKEKIDFNR